MRGRAVLPANIMQQHCYIPRPRSTECANLMILQESAEPETKEAPSAAPAPPSTSAAPKQQPAAKLAPAEPASAPRRSRKRGQGESYTDVPNSQIRKIIAKRLLESKLTVPHYYLRGHADLATVTALRKTLKEQGAKVSCSPGA
jgi:pyruvate/2-oxoglutarate dehydrogenase complex dihydrolipoamide acyltransferase (E2) component